MPSGTRAGVFAAVLLGLIAAAAQPVTTTQITGSANIGAVTRQVTMRFTCAVERGKINNLAAGIDIPDAEKFKSVFDVELFEGPGALSGKMHLTASAGSAQADLGSTGSFGNNGAPGASFTFQSAATPRERAEHQKLQALASALSKGTGKLTWRIENPAKGKPAIDAVADLTDQDAVRLKAAVGPCGVK